MSFKRSQPKSLQWGSETIRNNTALKRFQDIGLVKCSFGTIRNNTALKQAMQSRIMEELKKAYRPEFINRIDEKVVFHSLEEEQLREIVKIMVKPLVSALAEKGIDLKFQLAALKHLAKDGYDVEMGARPLRRTIQTQVEDRLSELLLGGQVVSGQTLKIGCSKDKLTFTVV